MSKAKQGDKVKINLTIRLENGDIVSSSEGQEPIVFTVGNKEVMPKIEDSVIDMALGEKREVTLSPEEGYGETRPELIEEVAIKDLPSGITPEVGMQLKGVDPSNKEVFLTITHVTESTVTIDANHPLAGKNLKFDIELLELG